MAVGSRCPGLATRRRRWFARALALWPGYIDALVNAGNTLRRMGRFEDALRQHEQALRLDPNSLDALYSQAGVLGALGRLDEAIAASDRALAIDPGLRLRRCGVRLCSVCSAATTTQCNASIS